MTKPRIAILTGYGINSDVELAHSFNLAGGDAVRVHLHDAIDGRTKLDDFAIVVVTGSVVTRFTAKSQSQRAMGKADFQASKDAVLDLAAQLIGATPQQIEESARTAA